MWSESNFVKATNRPERKLRSGVDNAAKSFKRGEPILIHDANDRENEVDIVFPAKAVTPDDVAQMRNDAGGLICVAVSNEVAEAFNLPFLHEVIEHKAGETKQLAYDDRSSFSWTVNHRDTFTGIVDNDRALTISKLGDAAASPSDIDFGTEFDMPGHIHLLKAASGLLEERQGHTELGIALAEYAGVSPAVVVCEMLDDQTGGALSRTNAESYATEHNLVFVDASTIVNKLRMV
ncbi:3,4-dihydroxy-2-butanone-4-phosphate synthase [Halobellus sp. GM3]|uniref:3,4-dihydroxy-2-butanone-4-phosphate synthase n=1 Tax=Halobellus sp. GM3 TaxID=3458410 RepID=UPI00403DACF6